MVMFKEEEMGLDLPSSQVVFTKADVIEAMKDMPDDAIMTFVGMFDSFDIVFRWKRQLTAEEEVAAREEQRLEALRLQMEEAPDRKLGF